MSGKDIRQQFADTLLEVGRRDDKLVVMVGDISHFKLQPFSEACPGRFYNIGICEPTMISMGAGLAKAGLYPVVHTIAPFIVERSYEQIKLDFCYQKLGGNIITVGSAFDYSNLGCTHHCYVDFSLLKSLPETQIMFPASAQEFDVLFKQNYKNGKLNYFRIPKNSHGHEYDPNRIKVGQGLIIQEGRDVSVIVTGSQLKNAIQAAKILQQEDCGVEIIYMHTIKPFDQRCVRGSLEKTRKVLVVEEHSMYGGLGDEVLRTAKDIEGIKYATIAIPDDFIRGYGSYEDLCRDLGFTVEGMVKKIKQDLIGG